MSSIYGRGPKGKATKLHSLVVRARGACERCGSTSQLECAHIIGRNAVGDPDGVWLRVNPDNAWCLCSSCHRRTGEHADDFMELVGRTIGERLYLQFKRAKYAPHRAWRDADWVWRRASGWKPCWWTHDGADGIVRCGGCEPYRTITAVACW